MTSKLIENAIVTVIAILALVTAYFYLGGKLKEYNLKSVSKIERVTL